MPALEMAQETGKVLKWLKAEGDAVKKSEPLMEIETDKVTVEIEAPASGVLGGVRAGPGDVIPVGQIIAWILAPGETAPVETQNVETGRALRTQAEPISASPVARQIAQEHGIDLARVKPGGGRIEKADVLAYLALTPRKSSRGGNQNAIESENARDDLRPTPSPATGRGGQGVGAPASPKARRLAREQGVDIATLQGSGPEGAVLAADVPLTPVQRGSSEGVGVSTVWRVMAERMTQSWTSAPHFYLTREVTASALVEMRARITPAVEERNSIKPTYTDLLVKLAAMVLRNHPRVNARWADGTLRLNNEINIGIATAIEDGLIVPVIRNADQMSIAEIAKLRDDLVSRATAGKLRPADIAGGTFTITNLGMYNIDAFSAIVNPPQAAILAVGRIVDRVVPLDGQPAVRPMMILTLSCDHRVVDGARGAKFLDDLAHLIEEPWGLLA